MRSAEVSPGSDQRLGIRFSVQAGRSDLLPPRGLSPAQVWSGLDKGVLAYGYALGGRWWMQWPGVGTFVLTAAPPEAVVVPDRGIDPETLDDSIRRGATPVALLQREHEVLHASAVSHPRGVVAFCAPSGTGKSTLAAALAGAGCRFWADDFLAWTLAAESVQCSWFPSAGRLDPAAAAAVAPLGPASLAVPHTRTVTLAAIAILARDARADRGAALIRPIQPERAFTAVLPHAHDCRIGGAARVRRSLERYLALCDAVPVFEVSFEPGLSRLRSLANHVVRWMDSLPAPASP